LIKYDPKLFYCEYVRIKKITSNYIYVTTRADGSVYKSDKSIKDVYKKRDIAKIRIHENVSRQYFKNYSMKEFKDVGQFACIAFYEDIVIAVEVQSLIHSVKENQAWVATIDRIMGNIYSVIPKNQDVFINGKEIFWIKKDDENEEIIKDSLNLSKDKCFSLKEVKYLELSKIGVTVSQKEKTEIVDGTVDKATDSFSTEVIRTIGSKRALKSENIANLNFEINYIDRSADKEAAIAFLKTSYVLAYNPYGELTDFQCYSPILSFDNDVISTGKDKERKIIDALYSLKDSDVVKDNPSYLNLNFALNAGKVIGEKYGFEETEILKIPSIIKDTGVVSFQKRLQSSCINYPLKLMPFDGLAWLFRFVNMEQDLNEQRDLSNLFSKVLKQGFVSQNKVEIKFKESKSEEDIKMLHYSPSFNKNIA